MKKGNRSANLMPHYKDGGAVEKKVKARREPGGVQQWTRAGVTGDDIEDRAKNSDEKTRLAAARAAGTEDARKSIANAKGRVPRTNKRLAESHHADGKPALVVSRRGKPRGGK